MMIYKKLYFQIILRIILILANALLFAYLFFLDKYIATQINLIFLLIIQGILLINYLNKTNRDLANFFSSVINNDSSVVFKQDGKNKFYSELYKNLNEVNRVIEHAKIEKIAHYEYLKQVVENVGIGILAYDEDLMVQFFNPDGKDILKINHLKSLDDLDSAYSGFSNKINNLIPNHQQLIYLKNYNFDLELSVKLVEFIVNNKRIKLLAFQNIQSELNKKEVESWQKIIRVLTHEIMNSVSPIDSATNSIYKLYKTDNKTLHPSDITEEIVNKTVKGLNIIQQRSKGMLSFVQKFRDLTLLPEPNFEVFKVQDLFSTIEILFKKDLEYFNIDFQLFITPDHLKIKADKSQIEQVLINLIRNSVDSLKNINDPILKIKSYKNDQNKVVISVNDNGVGIKPDIIDHIFTPFFTTKETGSGIGLSLSRQIMYLHGGNILVKSQPNIETIFTLQF